MVGAEDIFPKHQGADEDFRRLVMTHQRREGMMIAKLVVPAGATANRSSTFFGVYSYSDQTVGDEIERKITGHRVYLDTHGSANELCEVINKHRVAIGLAELTVEKEVITLKPEMVP